MQYLDYLILCEIRNGNDINDIDFTNKEQLKISIKKLVDERYLLDLFNLSEKGLEITNQFKAKRVILNAAGKGSRLQPLTNKTPKPLIKVHNKPIIEQTIENIINSIEIEEIIIVVWWLKDQFNYLIDKYKDDVKIRLITNNEANIKNNISTYEKVKNLTKNAYVIDGDIIIKSNILKNYLPTSTYFSKFEKNNTKEWCLNHLNGKVNQIVVGGKNSYINVGISYLSQSDSLILKQSVDDLYVNDKNHVSMYWDDLVKLSIKNLDFNIVEISSDSIVEIDNLEELKLIDSKYANVNYNQINYIIKLIHEIFYVPTEAIENLTKISGGLTNKAYKFSIKDINYFIRIPKNGSNELVDRVKEYDIYQVLKNKEFCEEIIYLDPNTGIKISKLINGETLTPKSVKQNISKIALMLKKYHSLDLKCNYDIDFERMLINYENLVTQSNFEFYPNYFEKRDKILNKYNAMKSDFKLSLCHNDLVSGNLILSNDQIYVIDWEYGGNTDIAFEIASLFLENDLNETEKKEFYLNYECNNEFKQRVDFWMNFQDLIWSVWHIYIKNNNVQSSDPSYGIKRFTRIKV